MMEAEQIAARLTGEVWVGVDRSHLGDTCCEWRVDPDGTITILDIYTVRAAIERKPHDH